MTTMKQFLSTINCVFVLITIVKANNVVFSSSSVAVDASHSQAAQQPMVDCNSAPALSCPANSRICGRPSPLANFLCYTNQAADGLNYAFIYFGDGIVAFVSIKLDCQPGVASILDVQIVYGFIFKLTYPVKCGDKIEQRSKIWYVNLSVKGCPSIEEIENYEYNNQNGQFNPALNPTPLEKNVAYLVYQKIVSDDYNAQCNVFRSERVDESCGSCCSNTRLTTRIVLDQVKTALVYNADPNSNGSAIQYIRDYGICGLNCVTSKTPEPGIKPLIFQELCTSDGYTGLPYCRNFQKSAQLYEIAQSYDYDGRLENLDVYEACELSTLWAQGYNCNKRCDNDGSSTSSYCPQGNAGGGTFTFCSIAIIPQAKQFINFQTSAFPQAFILYILLKGYCSIRTKEDIMQYFVNAC